VWRALACAQGCHLPPLDSLLPGLSRYRDRRRSAPSDSRRLDADRAGIDTKHGGRILSIPEFRGALAAFGDAIRPTSGAGLSPPLRRLFTARLLPAPQLTQSLHPDHFRQFFDVTGTGEISPGHPCTSRRYLISRVSDNKELNRARAALPAPITWVCCRCRDCRSRLRCGQSTANLPNAPGARRPPEAQPCLREPACIAGMADDPVGRCDRVGTGSVVNQSASLGVLPASRPRASMARVLDVPRRMHHCLALLA
jgi:hypothetical protein